MFYDLTNVKEKIMNQYSTQHQSRAIGALQQSEGLRTYMRGIFVYMTLGIVVTFLVSLFVQSSPSLINIFFSNKIIAYAVMFAPIILAIALAARQSRASVTECHIFFWAFAVVFGIGLAPLFIIFQASEILNVLMITAGTFGVMAVFGYTTKTDLTSLGFFAGMALLGAVIASIVNFFFIGAAFMSTVISVVVVGACVVLTAYETQELKQIYYSHADGDTKAKYAILGALNLYINFILIFKNLLFLLYSDE
jgi:FtsH-binding integral membrane protein